MSRPTTKTTNLTPARTDLIGRNLELARLREIFATSRFVTVTGIGGTGKTRLAREFGQISVTDFPGGVWMVELAKFDGVDEALRELADMLGLGFADPATSVAPIIEALRNKPRTLVVFDNVEHLIDQIADPISRILDGTKDVCILATSREPVRIAGEQRFKLTPLGHEAAVRLFQRRATEVIPSFKLDDSNREVIEELVDRLDRLPLAIELAASRINVLPPEKLMERLSSRMHALRAKDRDRPERHETLAATIEWSWELLDKPQRDGLAQCSAFRGGFTLDALESVVDYSGFAEDLVEDLVERSLIEFEDGDYGRRFFLFEMVRSAAEAKLAQSGESEDVFARHAQFYVDLIERTSRPQLYERRPELPNLLAALRRVSDPDRKAGVVLAASRLLRLSGGVALVEETLSELVGVASDDKVVAALLMHRAVAVFERREVETALSDLDRAIDIAQKAGDSATAADAFILKGLMLTDSNRDDEAREQLARGLEIARDTNDARLEASALGNLGISMSNEGKLKKAEAYFTEAVGKARLAKDDVLTGRSLMNLAVCQSIQRRWQEALANLEESLEFHERVGDDRYRGRAYNALGHVRARLGDVDAAFEAYTLGHEFAHNLGDREAETVALIGLGELGRSQSDRTYLVKAVQLNEGGSHWNHEAKARSHLAVSDMLERRHELARPQFRRAIGLVADHDSRWSGLLWGYLALSYAMTADSDTALDALKHLRSAWVEYDESVLDSAVFGTVVEVVAAGTMANPGDVASLRRQVDALQEADLSEFEARAPGWYEHHPGTTLKQLVESVFGPASAMTLAVARDGRRFIPPGEEEVDFSRRGPLRKIIVALAEAREESMGEGLSADDVLEAGWPGDIVTPDAGAARVYSAIRTLRANGLEDVLLTQDDGYLFDPDVAILWLD